MRFETRIHAVKASERGGRKGGLGENESKGEEGGRKSGAKIAACERSLE